MYLLTAQKLLYFSAFRSGPKLDLRRSFRTYLGSYSNVGPSTYQNQGQNLAGNSNYGWKYGGDDYGGGWYQTGIVNPRK